MAHQPGRPTALLDDHGPFTPVEVLVVLRAPAADAGLVGKRFPLPTAASSVTLGAGADCGILLEAKGVSRLHARLVRAAAGWSCLNESSLNGTFVNDQRVAEPVALVAGDRLRLGALVLGCLSASQLAAIDREPTSSSSSAALPFPIAVIDAVVDAQTTGLGRVNATIAGIEVGLRFYVAWALAVCTVRGGEPLAAAVAVMRMVEPDRPLTMGAVHSIAMALSKPLSKQPNTAIGEVARAFIDRDGRRTPLADSLEKLVQYRNSRTAHALTNDVAFDNEDAVVDPVREAFVAAMAPLRNGRLVSVADRDALDDEEGFIYKLQVHQGASELFAVETVILQEKLRQQWCHLLFDQTPPLCLAPMIAAVVPPGGSRIEVMMAQKIILGPKGSPIALKSITSQNKATLEVPGDAALLNLYASIRQPA